MYLHVIIKRYAYLPLIFFALSCVSTPPPKKAVTPADKTVRSTISKPAPEKPAEKPVTPSDEAVSPTRWKTLEAEKWTSDVQFSPKGNYLAYRDFQAYRILDRDHLPVWKYDRGESFSNPVTRLSDFSPDDKYFAFIMYPNNEDIGVLRVSDRKIIQVLKGHPTDVGALAFSPDGRFLASGSRDETVIIWERDGDGFSRSQTLHGHAFGVYALAFSPDGRFLASGSYDTTVRIWKLDQGEFSEHQTLRGHSDYVYSVAFSPNGEYLASGGKDQTLRIWKLSGEEFSQHQTLKGHSDSVYSVAFSPNGKYLASGSTDQTIGLWKFAGDSFSRFSSLKASNWVYSVSFDSSGNTLLCGGKDKQVTIWKMSGYTDQRPPKIEILDPDVREGEIRRTTQDAIRIVCRVTDENGVHEIFLNNSPMPVLRHGKFSAKLPLGMGQNPIRIRAVDKKQNVSERSFVVERE